MKLQNKKLEGLVMTSEGNEDYPNQYLVVIEGNEFVTWTPVELNLNDSYDVEIMELRKLKLGNEWKELPKVRLTKPSGSQNHVTFTPVVPTAEPSSTKSTPTVSAPQVQKNIYHQMTFDYLVRTGQLSLINLNKLGPRMESILNGTISQNDLGLLNLEFYGKEENYI